VVDYRYKKFSASWPMNIPSTTLNCITLKRGNSQKQLVYRKLAAFLRKVPEPTLANALKHVGSGTFSHKIACNCIHTQRYSRETISNSNWVTSTVLKLGYMSSGTFGIQELISLYSLMERSMKFIGSLEEPQVP
jgi:hypothetical protein